MAGARSIASIRPKTVLCCTTKTSASAVVTASLCLPACAAVSTGGRVWLGAWQDGQMRSALAAPRRTTARRNREKIRSQSSGGRQAAGVRSCGSTKAIVIGDGDASDIYRARRDDAVAAVSCGHATAYGRPDAKPGCPANGPIGSTKIMNKLFSSPLAHCCQPLMLSAAASNRSRSGNAWHIGRQTGRQTIQQRKFNERSCNPEEASACATNQNEYKWSIEPDGCTRWSGL